MTTIGTRLRKVSAAPVLALILFVGFALGTTRRVDAQTADAQTKEVASNEGTTGSPIAPATTARDTEMSPAIARQFAAMQAEIDELKAELKGRAAPEAVSSAIVESPAKAAESMIVTVPTPPAMATTMQTVGGTPAAEPAKPEPAAPFAYADWTWLNGTARNKDAVWDSKFFTPEVRFDTSFISSLNHPKDDTIGGSTEIFRSNEFQLDQISFGGDFHWQNVRGRILTMNGMFAVTTPRNDASPGRGQWDLRGAYKYVSEAYGGYHFDVNHGLNVDAGIFVSYIGLFSYYNFDNWAYQPSYVSSNTPWFFNGLRIQWFPTDKLKIEPWIINGWQSYGRYGTKPGLGGQILYRPKQWISLVFNNYGFGEDTLWTGNTPIGRSRIHTDDSVEIKYYDHPERMLDKMAFSLTGDLGCEYGGGVSCHKNNPIVGDKGGPKQSFAGWMAYNRWWFKKDTFGLTIGGGAFDNPGRYLTLLQPINGADAISGSPYFPEGPGLPFKAWDTSITWDWMPRQYITFRWEYGYRHANVPYFTGRGGITPPGGNNGSPAQYVCMDNTPSATPTGCGADGGLWTPDLRKDEPSIRLAIMVKF
ncbi:MAG TPA: outer membrane beta-barrel protein [Terriglobales bacterium]|nr:outer membrane beta-barrel protein [Terriglobales bacterium]